MLLKLLPKINNIFQNFSICLICILAISHANCSLTCYSNTLGTTGTTGSVVCANGIQACYKIITPFTGTSTTSGGGITYYPSQTTFTQAFISRDRGCVPVLDPGVNTGSTTGTQQTTLTQMKLGNDGVSTTINLVFNDWFTLIWNVCTNYGVCCFTNLCNSSIKLSLSQFNLICIAASVLLINFFDFT